MPPLLVPPFPFSSVGVGGMGPPILGTFSTFRVVFAGFFSDDADDDDDDDEAAPLFVEDITGWVTALFRTPCSLGKTIRRIGLSVHVKFEIGGGFLFFLEEEVVVVNGGA